MKRSFTRLKVPAASDLNKRKLRVSVANERRGAENAKNRREKPSLFGRFNLVEIDFNFSAKLCVLCASALRFSRFPHHSLRFLLFKNKTPGPSPVREIPPSAAIPGGAKLFIRYTHIKAQACFKRMSAQ
jgi:hypothetical protein